jgi:hypothetical protein
MFSSTNGITIPPWSIATVTGSASANAAEANHPGIIRTSSGAGANTGIGIIIPNLVSLILAGSERSLFKIRPQGLAALVIRAGFIDTPSGAEPTDGAYIVIETVGGIPGTLYGKTSAAAARSSTATSFVVSTLTWYTTEVKVDATATLITFTLRDEAGALLWSDTLNATIPTAVGQETSCGITQQSTSVGAKTLNDIDYIELEISRPLIR